VKLSPPTVVFVRPQAPGNIGALARVMSNFGLSELRLCGADPAIGKDPSDPFQTMDWALAKKGESILRSAQWFATLTDALHDQELVLGTSGRDLEFDKGYARPIVSPQVAFSQTASIAPQRWALVFGPEDDGLWDAESALCQKLIRIPTADPSPSINIAMAAGCLFYHFHLFSEGLIERDNQAGTRIDLGAFLDADRSQQRMHHSEVGRSELAQHKHKEAFLEYLMSTLSLTSFLKYPDQAAVRARVRRWLQFANMPLGELLFAFELLYHFRSWGTGRFEPRDFLKTPVEPKNS
jgi:TrmH family RNA methyltransferase